MRAKRDRRERGFTKVRDRRTYQRVTMLTRNPSLRVLRLIEIKNTEIRELRQKVADAELFIMGLQFGLDAVIEDEQTRRRRLEC